ncbi:MAG: transglutaminase domain-containing protein [Ferruginibacter sp.]
MKRTIILLSFIFSTSIDLFAQNKDNSATDEYVKNLGPLSALNVATIADTITEKFTDKYDKARAIFYWISNNIQLDPKAIKSNDNKRTDPVDVIQFRKTTPGGFSLLIQEMCSMANIRCLSVDGYVKYNATDINNKADDMNHSWNVVQLGQSPEQWYYVDAAKGSGYVDLKTKLFVKQFTSEYFFADKTLFNLDHYPDNQAWQLGIGPKSLKEFYALPVISNAAYKYGLQRPDPRTGYIKTKSDAAVKFTFNYNNKIPINNIFLQMGEEKKQWKPEPINFNDNGGSVTFTYKFKKADTYPVRIVADGNELLQYFVESEE